MAETIKTLDEAKALLAEYRALPDLAARINWDGYNRLPDYTFSCVCGRLTTYPMGLDDLERTIDKGWEWKLEHHEERCFGHDDTEEDDDGEDEENDDEEEVKNG